LSGQWSHFFEKHFNPISGLPDGLKSNVGVNMEFLNLSLMTYAAWLVLKRPEKERLAFCLLLVCLALTVFAYEVGARTSLVPRVNL